MAFVHESVKCIINSLAHKAEGNNYAFKTCIFFMPNLTVFNSNTNHAFNITFVL